MSQQQATQQISAPFHIKSAGVSLFVISVIGIYYFANVLSLLPSDDPISAGAINLAIITTIAVIVLQAMLQTVLFIGTGKIEERSDRDKHLLARASRNAYVVMSLGVVIALASLLIGFTTYEVINIFLLAFLLSQVANYASQLFYYRRTAN